MEEKRTAKEERCNLIMENRSKLSVTGVMDVDSFDEQTIVLMTELGALIVKGADFHINKLNVDSGELVIEGNIDICQFNDGYGGKSRGSLFSKIFK